MHDAARFEPIDQPLDLDLVDFGAPLVATQGIGWYVGEPLPAPRGLGAGALLTAPFWWPYGYASPSYYPYYPYSYSYPYYEPYPVYSYPAPVPGSAPPAAAPATPTTPTPPLAPPAGGQGPTPPAAGEGATARRCDAVWVEGHYETHVGPSGQASTFWIPGATRQICQ